MALELRGVSNRAAGVQDVSLTVRRGEIVGVAGLVGSGRTQLAETLFGLTPADAGEILVHGARAAIQSPADAIRAGIAYVPEDRRQHGVVLEMSVASNASLASLERVSRRGLIDRRAERESAQRYVDQFRIKTASLEAEVGTLSGGNQQKVALARWLATEPSILILDEPTQGVDVGSKAEIHGLMQRPRRARARHPHDLVGAAGDRRHERSRRRHARGDDPRRAPARRGDAGPHPGARAGRGRRRHERRRSALMSAFARHRREVSVGAAIAALVLVLAFVAPHFFAPENLLDLLLANVPVLVVALGMTLVVLTGQIDISVGSTFAICGVAAGLLAKADVPLPLVALGTCAAGAALGSLNGAFVAYARIPSIVATLATMVALRDGLRWTTEGAWIQDLPVDFQWLGLSQTSYPLLAGGMAFALAAGFAWGLRNLPAGRAVYATGSNADAARLAGFRTAFVTFSTFAVLGGLTGLAALLNSVRFNQIPSNAGLGLEMKVIAAVVVGGVAITGGRGKVAGTLLGVLLLGMIGPALTFLGVSAYWERAIQGAIILAAVARR